ncbi:NADP-dependent oxidoreductase [uncultured Roseibium sp.]|uniref:NADP-dependent oxidoreductase n=1 Tax=uncultured Roseibium sp. TaxID=1936171 RepID=UPI002591B0C8|nr:NADP-dependent oxidoreductase [uncultured Roseibium sp.]
MQNKRIVLASRPSGRLVNTDFETRNEALPSLEEGKARVRVVYVSLDPAMRGWVSPATNSYLPPIPLGETMRSLGIGIVTESRCEGLSEGDWVSGFTGWTEYLDVEPGALNVVPQNVPMEAYMGVFGLAGATAYHGLVKVGEPKRGETLCVTGAAGSVGSLVGQIGKALGLRVIGIAGTKAKCDWLVNELGFDAALNYKTDDLDAGLQAFAPEGLDLHFENVGGKPFAAALRNMKAFGRIVMCGFISVYNGDSQDEMPDMTAIVRRRLTIKGFVMTDHFETYPEIFKALGEMLQAGQLKYRLDIVEGLENAPAALNKLFDGSNQGKLVVKVSDL